VVRRMGMPWGLAWLAAGVAAAAIALTPRFPSAWRFRLCGPCVLFAETGAASAQLTELALRRPNC
jgi:hypothetical protein